jgi:hypothetical protein
VTRAGDATVGARRGPPLSLELDQILTAALRLFDRNGARAFNTRALASVPLVAGLIFDAFSTWRQFWGNET